LLFLLPVVVWNLRKVVRRALRLSAFLRVVLFVEVLHQGVETKVTHFLGSHQIIANLLRLFSVVRHGSRVVRIQVRAFLVSSLSFFSRESVVYNA